MPAGGKIGNKGGGRKKQKIEMNFFKALDLALPGAVELCNRFINESLSLGSKKFLGSKEIHDRGLMASKILMSKAPQRIQGSGEDGAILIKTIGMDI